MNQQSMKDLRAGFDEIPAPVVNDTQVSKDDHPVFEEVDLFATALIQGSCADPAQTE